MAMSGTAKTGISGLCTVLSLLVLVSISHASVEGQSSISTSSSSTLEKEGKTITEDHVAPEDGSILREDDFRHKGWKTDHASPKRTPKHAHGHHRPHRATNKEEIRAKVGHTHPRSHRHASNGKEDPNSMIKSSMYNQWRKPPPPPNQCLLNQLYLNNQCEDVCPPNQFWLFGECKECPVEDQSKRYLCRKSHSKRFIEEEIYNTAVLMENNNEEEERHGPRPVGCACQCPVGYKWRPGVGCVPIHPWGLLVSLFKERGIQGTQGERGFAGPPGMKGEDGQPGPRGAVGIRGPVGKRGSTGASGRDGRPGRQGPPGSRGKNGPSGPMGRRGPNGPEGRPGQAAPEPWEGHTSIAKWWEDVWDKVDWTDGGNDEDGTWEWSPLKRKWTWGWKDGHQPTESKVSWDKWWERKGSWHAPTPTPPPSWKPTQPWPTRPPPPPPSHPWAPTHPTWPPPPPHPWAPTHPTWPPPPPSWKPTSPPWTTESWTTESSVPWSSFSHSSTAPSQSSDDDGASSVASTDDLLVESGSNDSEGESFREDRDQLGKSPIQRYLSLKAEMKGEKLDLANEDRRTQEDAYWDNEKYGDRKREGEEDTYELNLEKARKERGFLEDRGRDDRAEGQEERVAQGGMSPDEYYAAMVSQAKKHMEQNFEDSRLS